jgi:hypothetical protein
MNFTCFKLVALRWLSPLALCNGSQEYLRRPACQLRQNETKASQGGVSRVHRERDGELHSIFVPAGTRLRCSSRFKKSGSGKFCASRRENDLILGIGRSQAPTRREPSTWYLADPRRSCRTGP